MHSTAQKEQFSRAYVAAIAAQAGCNSAKPEVDDDSVDLTLKMKDLIDCRRSRSEVDIQRGFKFKVQHPVLGYWRLLKKLHRVS